MVLGNSERSGERVECRPIIYSKIPTSRSPSPPHDLAISVIEPADAIGAEHGVRGAEGMAVEESQGLPIHLVRRYGSFTSNTNTSDLFPASCAIPLV